MSNEQQLIDLIEQIGPGKVDWQDPTFILDSQARRDFRQKYGWAVPNREAAAAILAFAGGDPILEVMAGTGLWARVLADAGATITATDWKNHHTYLWVGRHAPCYYKVERLTACKAIEKYPHPVLMMCWPPYNEPVAAEALAAFKGDRVVYIGEGEGGCTGDDTLHKAFETEWELDAIVATPQWPALHDGLFLYRRK